MEVSRLGSIALVALLLTAVVAWSGEEEEVRRTGEAAPSIPAETDNPPDGFGAEHDPQEGIPFDGPAYYELLHGVDPIGGGWTRTDFLHWRANGATLTAKGQLHDGNPERPSTVSSQCWGATKGLVTVGAERGQEVKVTVKNRIQFLWDYLFAGETIGEASVQLHGLAYDVEGKQHRFDLSDHRSEQVTETVEEESGTSFEASAGIEGAFGQTPHGRAFRVGGGAGLGGGVYTRLNVAITRRLPTAGGKTGSSPEVVLQTSASYPTPFNHLYAVYSEGRATLRARASSAGDEDSGPVVVQLRNFTVKNYLRVFLLIRDDDRPPGEPWEGDGGEFGGILLFDAVSAVADADLPRGLDGEAGSLPGLLHILLSEPAPRDLVFDVGPDDPAVVALPGRPLVVEEGERWGSLPFHGGEPGATGIALGLLDEAGQPSGAELRVQVETASTSSYPETSLWATVPGRIRRPGKGVAIRAIRGGEAGPLRIGRLGFAGLETTETLVQIAVDDPESVLGPVPSSATIAAGKTCTDVPLLLNDVEGTARLVLNAGDEGIDVVVVSRSQAWQSAPAIRLPRDATIQVPFFLDYPAAREREVGAVSGDDAVVAMEGPGSAIRPGEIGWFVRAHGAALGETTVTLSTPGLPAISVPVEVVAADVEIREGKLLLRGLVAGAEGTVRLTAPEGVSFDSVDLPADSAEYLEVTGIGTSELVLRFTPGPNLPASLDLPLELGGDVSLGAEIIVFDALHEPAQEDTFHSYGILVR